MADVVAAMTPRQAAKMFRDKAKEQRQRCVWLFGSRSAIDERAERMRLAAIDEAAALIILKAEAVIKQNYKATTPEALAAFDALADAMGTLKEIRK